jgi:hypothetical protein
MSLDMNKLERIMNENIETIQTNNLQELKCTLVKNLIFVQI